MSFVKTFHALLQAPNC